MKTLAIYAFVVLSNMICLGCNTPWNGIQGNGNVKTEKRSVGNFDGVKVSGSYEVILVPGTEGNVTIDADENLMQYIMTEVNHNTLEIYTKSGVNISFHKKITITVAFQDIESAKLTGSGSITCKEVIKSTSFNAAVTGSGDVSLILAAETTEGKVTGSGDLSLSGKTDTFYCNVTGSGDISAYELKAKNADARVSGSGGIKLYCSEKLDANVTGSGDIYYEGSPKKQALNTTGSGDIHSR